MSFFVRKNRHAAVVRRRKASPLGHEQTFDGQVQRVICHELCAKKKGGTRRQEAANGNGRKNKRRIFMVTVEWENANELELEMLLEMAADGYSFCVGDGKIQSVGVALGMTS